MYLLLDLCSRWGRMGWQSILTRVTSLMCSLAITLLRVYIIFDPGTHIFILHRAHGLGSQSTSRAPHAPPPPTPPWATIWPPAASVSNFQNCCGCHSRPSTKTILRSDLNTLLLETPPGGGVGVEGCQWLLSALPVCTVFISFKPCKMKMGISNKIPKYVCSPQLSSCSWFSKARPLLISFLVTEEHVRWMPGFI